MGGGVRDSLATVHQAGSGPTHRSDRAGTALARQQFHTHSSGGGLTRDLLCRQERAWLSER